MEQAEYKVGQNWLGKDISLTVDETGIQTSSKKYAWHDIRNLKNYDSAFWNLIFWQGGTPLCYVYLKDKSIIKISGRHTRKVGAEGHIAFVSGKTDAYSELVSLIRSRIKLPK